MAISNKLSDFEVFFYSKAQTVYVKLPISDSRKMIKAQQTSRCIIFIHNFLTELRGSMKKRLL